MTVVDIVINLVLTNCFIKIKSQSTLNH